MYLQICISNEAKTSDNVKEYFLSAHANAIVYKLKNMQLKKQMTLHNTAKFSFANSPKKVTFIISYTKN